MKLPCRGRAEIPLLRALAGCGLALAAAAPALALTNPIPPGAVVRLNTIADIPGTSGGPNYLTHAGDGSGRAFVVGQTGRVHLIEDDALSPTLFLNIPGAGVTVTGSGERGLLGLAFHPNFDAEIGTPGRGKVYTYTSEPRTGTPDFNHPELQAAGLGDHFSVIREWSVSAANPNVVDTSIPSRVLMRINQPQSNHNGGAIAFGPDSNLYIALGDGGGGNDFNGSMNSTVDGHTNGGLGNAQDLTNVYGSILRIDPLGITSANGQYSVPADNPFFGETFGVDEIYAYGLRNPFRMGFDRDSGDLWVGDVGQGRREEIDRIQSGGNYGWVYMEGTVQNRAGGPAGMIPPIGEYTHSDGNAIIGGFVYRGTKLGPLYGKYIFGDLAGNMNLGRLFYMDVETGNIAEFVLDAAGDNVPGQLLGVGEDEAGEIYYLFSGGDVVRVELMPGDANADGRVDIFDVAEVSNNWGLDGPVGDVNFDRVVDIFDVATISNNWTASGGANVPEPSGLALLAVAAATIAAGALAKRSGNTAPSGISRNPRA